MCARVWLCVFRQGERQIHGQIYRRWIYATIQEKILYEHRLSEARFPSDALLKIRKKWLKVSCTAGRCTYEQWLPDLLEDSRCRSNRLKSVVFSLLQVMDVTLLWHEQIRSKQIPVEHNFIKYSYSYMFRPYRVIIRLTFRTYWKKCTYCIVAVRSRFLCILLLMCSKSQSDDDPLRSKHTAVWILYKFVFIVYSLFCSSTQRDVRR